MVICDACKKPAAVGESVGEYTLEFLSSGGDWLDEDEDEEKEQIPRFSYNMQLCNACCQKMVDNAKAVVDTLLGTNHIHPEVRNAGTDPS